MHITIPQDNGSEYSKFSLSCFHLRKIEFCGANSSVNTSSRRLINKVGVCDCHQTLSFSSAVDAVADYLANVYSLKSIGHYSEEITQLDGH